MLTGNFYLLRAVGIAILLGTLSACSVNGTYPDATEPDAAKLRFISAEQSATLDVYDDAHCTGRTTGILNNPLMANTKRRADMQVAAPAGADAYLEVKLPPGKELLVRVNTLGNATVCGTGFNFIPHKGSEYELTFNYEGNLCKATLTRLANINGKVLRDPMVVVDKGLPACSANKAPARVADTPARVALIEQIIADSLTSDMQRPAVADNPDASAKHLDKVLAERKQQMGVSVPPAYWTEYRQIMSAFADDMLTAKPRALQMYKDHYRLQLQQLEDKYLKELGPDEDTLNTSSALQTNSNMHQYYLLAMKQLMAEALINQRRRMAELDERYDICSRFSDCWRQ